MPRLPDGDSIPGGDAPSGNSGRPGASFDASAQARGLGALGAGLQRFGAGVGAGAEKIGQAYQAEATADDNLALSKAESGYLSAKIELDDKLRRATDPNEVAGLQGEQKKLLDTWGASIPNAKLREKWLVQRAPDSAKWGVATQDRTFNIARDHELAAVETEQVEARRKALELGDEDQRKGVVDAMNLRFDAMAQKGYITQQDAVRRKQAFARGYVIDAFERMSPEQRLEALSPVKVDDRAKMAFDFFRSKGWTNEQAAGIVGNLHFESSGLNTGARNPGDGADGSDSIGLAQWNGARAAALKAFAAEKGGDWRDFGTQLAFVQHELETTHSGAAIALKGALTVRDSAGVFADRYEKPAGSGSGNYASIRHWDNRLRIAETIGNKFAGTPISDIPGGKLAGLLDPADAERIRTGAARELETRYKQEDIANRQEAATVKDLIGNDQASILDTGKAIADLTPERVEAAFGPEGRKAFEEDRALAQRYHDKTWNWDSVPAGEILASLEELRPKGGAKDYTRQSKLFDTVEKRADTILRARDSDPAAAVESAPNVRLARHANPQASVADLPSMGPIVAQRFVAQSVAGIPDNRQLALTHAEAVQLYAPIASAAGRPDIKEALAETFDAVKEAFGPQQAARVIEQILAAGKIDKEHREVLQAFMARIAAGQRVDARDGRAADDAGVEAAARRAAVAGDTSGEAPGATWAGPRLPQGAFIDGLTGETRNADGTPADAPPSPAKQPTIDRGAMEYLRQHPDTARQFDALYGTPANPKPSQRILELSPVAVPAAPSWQGPDTSSPDYQNTNNGMPQP